MSADVRSRCEPAEPQQRGADACIVSAESVGPTYGPLHFGQPFEDKGRGRSDYRLDWEDYVAMPNRHARFAPNWLGYRSVRSSRRHAR